MKYDDASWHSGGDYPDDLPDKAAATHAGMFLAWAVLADLGGEYHVNDCAEEIQQLKARQMTPGRYFLVTCDGKLTDQEFTDEANRFVAEYFEFTNGRYLADYEEALGKDLPSLYHVPDTWSSFDALKAVLDKRLEEWRLQGSSRDH